MVFSGVLVKVFVDVSKYLESVVDGQERNKHLQDHFVADVVEVKLW